MPFVRLCDGWPPRGMSNINMTNINTLHPPHTKTIRPSITFLLQTLSWPFMLAFLRDFGYCEEGSFITFFNILSTTNIEAVGELMGACHVPISVGAGICSFCNWIFVAGVAVAVLWFGWKWLLIGTTHPTFNITWFT